TMFAPFCNSFVLTHMTYAGIFGFFSGGNVGLTSIIVVDLVGIDKLSDAFGVLLLFQGTAVVLGTPIVGGLILFAIPVLKRRAERHQQPTKHQLQMRILSFSKQDLSASEQQQL
ncbi:unnamed protein product, partial [Rotaria sp. Silwood1]